MTEISISATIAAPVDAVWRAYTEPAHITQWNFASDDWCCPWAENDLRPGGLYRARMEAKDKSFGFDFESTWHAVEPESRLVSAIADGRKVTTTFEPQGGATRVTTAFEAEGVHPPEMQRAGWQSILDNFRRYVEAG